jgi:hypothetical protein
MSATLNSTSSIDAPVIIRVPVTASSATRMTVKEAEDILRTRGFRPSTAAERRRNRKLLRPAK